MKKLLFIAAICLFASTTFAVDATKTQGILMDWTAVPVHTTAGTLSSTESNELDSGESLDSAVSAIIHIDMCHAATTTATAGSAGVIVFIKSGTTDETWHEFIRFDMTAGTANSQALAAASGSGQGDPERIEVALTTNFEATGDVYFLKDAGTLANSCLVTNAGYKNDDYMMSMDDLVNAYGTDDYLIDIVDQWSVALPPTTQSAKVLCYNNDTDANYAAKVHYTLVTDIE